ncbi:MAG TPA: FHA domain-containing protein [Verrucomicrobiae bacterium]|jgi:pSer/pThr/pTyr-binding forkhead associated (FHA) protein|nr:FHA domain-containing protein [Verrucomicrobiae bacterium]
MIQLKVFSGKLAGSECAARRFPFRIGRSPASDLRLDEDGVWNEHLELAFDPAVGFILTTLTDALATLNGERFERAVLRNGDSIEIGALKIRFWVTASRQVGLRWREWLTWAALIFITAAQVWLIYWLSG